MDAETAAKIEDIRKYLGYSMDRLYAAAKLADLDMEVNAMQSESVYDPVRKELTEEYNQIIKRVIAAQNAYREAIAVEEKINNQETKS